MIVLLFLPFLIQSVAIFLDEWVFHRKRGLPKWERIGHPIDTLSVILCLSYPLYVCFSLRALFYYSCLALFSCLLVTKDEWVHKEHCPASEQWLHALLFVNHPLVLGSNAFFWWLLKSPTPPHFFLAWYQSPFLLLFLEGQLLSAVVFFLYQSVYWNFLWKSRSH